MLKGTFRTALVAAFAIASVMCGLYFAAIPLVGSSIGRFIGPSVGRQPAGSNSDFGAPATPAATPPADDRVVLALVERDVNKLLSVRPVFVFYATGRAIFLDGGISRNELSATNLPKYQTVGNIDSTALMRDLGTYDTFSKFRNEYVISEPEDPRGMIFTFCQSGQCKKISITGSPRQCRNRTMDCNLGLMPAELNKAIEYLSDFVHPDAEVYPLPKIDVVFTPKAKDESNPSFGKTTRGLPIPLVDWPADWPPLPPAAGPDGKFHILIDAGNFGKLTDLSRGLRVEDFGVIREGLLSIHGHTGLPSITIPLPGQESWLKN